MTKKLALKISALGLVIFASLLLTASPLAFGEGDGVTEPADTEKTTSRSERLKARKEQFKVVLGEEAKKRLSMKCAAAQKAVSTIKNQDGVIRDKRHGIYTKLVERIDAITIKLQNQGLSTAGLAEAQNRLTEAVNKYLADAETYRATVNDLAGMTCDNDVESWQATLQAARTQREQLKTDAGEIKAALADVKQALKAAKQALLESEAN